MASAPITGIRPAGDSTPPGPAAAVDDVIRFGDFVVRPVHRVLMKGGARVPLGNRAFDILLLLLDQAGKLVSNEAIFRHVWPRSVVVQNNLRVHVTALRKALDDGRDGSRWIVNVPNRGYGFVAPVSRGPSNEGPLSAAGGPKVSALAVPLHRIVGRDAAFEALAGLLRQHRLVSLVGAGGIGKTTLAVSMAARATSAPDGPWSGVHFVDLAPLVEGNQVPGAVAAVLGLIADVDDAMSNLLAHLHDKSLLLLLDNCEHVLGAAAAFAETVLRAAPAVTILATSREPLNAEGERVHRLQPLKAPDEGAVATASEAMRFGAIELFVERAMAADDSFAFKDADVGVLVDICRRLDGMPLAIELAAACMPSMGLHGIESALDDSFARLGTGRRTAIPRHRTLQAVLDWSLGLLSAHERLVFARISVFRGQFTLESAAAVAADDALAPHGVFEAMTRLVAKSLVAADARGDIPRFRLLETTRGYAREQLAATDQLPAVRHRHALHMLEQMQAAEQAWPDAVPAAWRQRHGRHVDDVKAALDWSLLPGGEPMLGMALVVRSALLLFQLSRTSDAMRYANAAMAALARSGTVDARLGFELRIVYGIIAYHTRGNQPATQQALEHALTAATTLAPGGDRVSAIAYSANWVGAYIRADPHAMQAILGRFEALVPRSTDPVIALLHARMKAQTLHLRGDQHGARLHAERTLASDNTINPPFLSGSQIDRFVSTGSVLVRILWLQGLPEQAERLATRTVERARREGQSVAFAFALAFAACPLALWIGRLDVARERVALLLRHTAEHSLVNYRAYALAFDALLTWIERGRKGSPVLPEAPELHERPVHLTELLATLHSGWADDALFARGDRAEAAWCQAELLRIRGERMLPHDRAAAESLFRRALEVARRHGALSWELRASVSLARLWQDLGRTGDAAMALRLVLDRLTEGHDTPDVQEAMALQDVLESLPTLPPSWLFSQPRARRRGAAPCSACAME